MVVPQWPGIAVDPKIIAYLPILPFYPNIGVLLKLNKKDSTVLLFPLKDFVWMMNFYDSDVENMIIDGVTIYEPLR